MASCCPREEAQAPGLAFKAHPDRSCSSRVGLVGNELWVVEPFVHNHLLSPYQPRHTCEQTPILTQTPIRTQRHVGTDTHTHSGVP